MKRILSEIITLHKEYFIPPAYGRTVKLDPDIDKVQTITGPRRTGKSSLMKLTIRQLLERGVDWDRICYLSLEDERLMSDGF